MRVIPVARRAPAMQAAVVRRYGPPSVVALEDVPRPEPAPNEVLIRVRATTVSTADWRMRSLTVPYGFRLMSRLALGVRAPRRAVLGSELSGDVVAVGASVRTFAPGDAVVAYPGLALGAHAEYCCLSANAAIVSKPERLSYETAAALAFGGTTALDFLRRAELKAGESVLVNGASGTVGSAMVQLAVAAGAQVTAVCSSVNADIVQQLGATRVVDYTRTDFAAEGARYDIIADTVGNTSYARVRHALRPRGRVLLLLATLPEMLSAAWMNRAASHRVIVGSAAERVEDLRTLVTMAADGRFTPLIDSSFALSEIAAAHARVETQRKRGSVLVMCAA
jgi:NADPH:quinone reductase-like Zn-dependent oxidoreductase